MRFGTTRKTNFKSAILRQAPLIGSLFLLLGLGQASDTTQTQSLFSSKLKIYQHLKDLTSTDKFHNLEDDLNGDQNKDLLVGPGCRPGKPCLYYIFLQEGAQFRFKGKLYFDAGNYEILMVDNLGMKDILWFQFQTGKVRESDGLLLRYRYDGQNYNLLKSAIGSAQLREVITP